MMYSLARLWKLNKLQQRNQVVILQYQQIYPEPPRASFGWIDPRPVDVQGLGHPCSSGTERAFAGHSRVIPRHAGRFSVGQLAHHPYIQGVHVLWLHVPFTMFHFRCENGPAYAFIDMFAFFEKSYCDPWLTLYISSICFSDMMTMCCTVPHTDTVD